MGFWGSSRRSQVTLLAFASNVTYVSWTQWLATDPSPSCSIIRALSSPYACEEYEPPSGDPKVTNAIRNFAGTPVRTFVCLSCAFRFHDENRWACAGFPLDHPLPQRPPSTRPPLSTAPVSMLWTQGPGVVQSEDWSCSSSEGEYRPDMLRFTIIRSDDGNLLCEELVQSSVKSGQKRSEAVMQV